VLLSSGDSFPHLIQKPRSQLGFVTYLLNRPHVKESIHPVAVVNETHMKSFKTLKQAVYTKQSVLKCEAICVLKRVQFEPNMDIFGTSYTAMCCEGKRLQHDTKATRHMVCLENGVYLTCTDK
jgi:hypothetical protein